MSRLPRPMSMLRRAFVGVLSAGSLLGAVAVSLAVGSASAEAETKLFRVADAAAAIAGETDGVAIDGRGRLSLGVALERLASVDQPFILSAAPLADGWLIGTGSSGRVVAVSAEGASRVVGTLERPQAFAVLGRGDGELLAADSPDGAVRRLDPSTPEEAGTIVFDPQSTYIWDLAETADGGLLVATGLPGALWRVTEEGAAEKLYEAPDAHVRTVLPLADGGVLLGTAGQGLVVHLGADGAAETLYDATEPEIAALAVDGDGAVYAAAVASESSQVDLSAQAGAEPAAGGEVVVAVRGSETIGSRAGDATGPRSAVVRLDPDGGDRRLVAWPDQTVHSLLWRGNALWIATGEQGRLYRWADDLLSRQATLSERQIVRLVDGPAGAAAITTDGGAAYRLADEVVETGTYTSAVLDAERPARFGAVRWRGTSADGAGVSIEARSGASSEPDSTWSAWTQAERGTGQTYALEGLPANRFLQWRASLEQAGGTSVEEPGTRIVEVTVSYRQINLAPTVDSFEALDPGEILVPSSFNADTTTFEPWSPNRDGIFTTLRTAGASDDGRTKTLYKKGWRTLRWSATDPNADTLHYALAARRADHEETNVAAGKATVEDTPSDWLSMVDALDTAWYSFDSTVLPEGVWRFRLTATDADGRPAEEALEAERIGEPVIVDHSPPRLVAQRAADGRKTIDLRDAHSPIRSVEVSIDAGAWRPVVAADGLLDGQRETVSVAVDPAARTVLLRVMDAAFNVVTFDLSTD